MKTLILALGCCLAPFLVRGDFNQVSASPLTYLMNLDARSYGDPGSGLPTFHYTLPAGVWKVTFTSPGLTPGAAFYAWSPFASAEVWNTSLSLRPVPDEIGSTTSFSDPPSAFNNVSTLSWVFTVIATTDFQAYFRDNLISDNRGGQSLLFEKLSDAEVPEASTALAGISILLLVGCSVLRRSIGRMANG